MQKKKLPIFHKVSNLLKIPILLSKMRKPIITKLIFLQKSKKQKSFILLKHHKYNYGYLDHKYYEFSPSSTPLIHCCQRKLRKDASYCHSIYSMFFLSKCLGGLRGGEGEVDCPLPLETVFPASIVPAGEYLQPLDFGDEQDSVDQRAERFIQRFYYEMRMQRRESF